MAQTLDLRAAVASVPATVHAALRTSQGAGQLTLAFGSSLAVDLRTGPAGLELTLHPAAGLSRAAEAEVPALLAALRHRGLRVRKVGVAPQARPQGRAHAAR